jgi:hypothetical protein
MSEIQEVVPSVQDSVVDSNLIERLNNREIKLSDLTDSQQQKVLNGEISEAPVQATPPRDLERPKVEQRQEEVQKFDPNLAYKQKADELNHARQMLAKRDREADEHNRRLKEDTSYRNRWLEENGLAPKIEVEDDFDDLDVFDEKVLRETIRNQKRIEAKQRELDEKYVYEEKLRKADAEVERSRANLDKTFRSIEDLQNEFPELKTSKNFKELNSDYNSLTSKIGLDNVDRVMSDQNYRQSLINQGVDIPVDLDKIIKILQINETATKNNYPTLRSAFLDTNDFRTSLQQQQTDQTQTVYQNGLEKSVNKFNELNSQQPTAPNSGTNSFVDGGSQMTTEWMINWLKTNNNPQIYTSVEREIRDRIGKAINGG